MSREFDNPQTFPISDNFPAKKYDFCWIPPQRPLEEDNPYFSFALNYFIINFYYNLDT